MNSLFARLTAGLLLVLLLVGALFAATTWYLAQQHTQLVTQTFNRDLAARLINDRRLINSGQLDDTRLKGVFEEYMSINPNLEIYLLDTEGNILSHSAPRGSIVRPKVSMQPIRTFLGNDKYEPVLGDDPRSATRGKAFSVAPVNTSAGMLGYLYVVLSGEAFAAVEQTLQQQYLLRIAQRVLLISLLAGLLAGLAILWSITRRVTRLTNRVQAYATPVDHTAMNQQPTTGDEITRLDQAFTEMSERIDAQIAALRSNDKKRRNMIAAVSHDLRTPLAALLGYLQTLGQRSDVMADSETRQWFDIALKNAQRLSTLVDELFELARLEAGGVAASLEPVSLTDLVQDVVLQQTIAARSRGVELSALPAPGCPLVHGDPAMLQRVLENLIANAVQHTRPGDRIEVRLRADADRVETTVWDSGAAIDKKTLARLFDPFYKGRRSDERDRHAGLGLSIARHMVALHNGELRVANDRAGGKRFMFSLPLFRSEPQTRPRRGGTKIQTPTTSAAKPVYTTTKTHAGAS